MIRLSAILALAFGGFLFVAEIVRNWGDWQWWPFWVVDYIAAGLLIFGGQRALNTGTVRWLTGGWGFTAAMFWMSFFSHIDQLRREADEHNGPVDETVLTTIIGVMLVVALVGFLGSLLGDRKPGRATGEP
ncbi:MAG: hypothetical protein AAF768_00170 [Pseudomonadota bacterium]